MSPAGGYNNWLVFQRLPTPNPQDSMGTPIGTYSTHFETAGAFEPAGSREFPEGYKRHAEATARFRIPYPDITIDPALHRIVMVFDEESSPPWISTWNVLGAEPVDGKKFELLVEVNEVR